VRHLKSVFALFSEHKLLGVPLDWPLRFLALAGLYVLLRRRLRPRPAAGVCLALLLLKEAFDCFAVLNPLRPRPPDAGDLADVLSGLLGLVAAALLLHVLHRRGRNAHASRPGVDRRDPP